jgi:DNA-binding XRE family transcriptional regulator
VLPKADAGGNYHAAAFARASIARKIIQDRANAGLSQKQLANLAGVRVETLCRIETGKHTPSLPTIDRIDRALRQVSIKKPSAGR